MAEALHEVMAEYKKGDLSVRLVDGLLAILPFVPELPFVATVDEAARRSGLDSLADRVAARVHELAAQDGAASALRTARLLDKGDRGIALYSGLRGVYKAVKKEGVQAALETDPQQLADAGLKAVGIAWMAWKLYPGSAAERAEKLWQSAAGQALLGYFVAIEIALPFADNVASGGGAFVGDLIENQASANAARLAAVGVQADEAMGFLRAISSRLQEMTGRAAAYIQPISQMASEKLPGVMQGADAALGAVATAADALDVYGYLGSQLVLETCLARAVAEVRAEVAEEERAAEEARRIEEAARRKAEEEAAEARHRAEEEARRQEEERRRASAVRADYQLDEGQAASSLDQVGIRVTRSSPDLPVESKKSCLGCALPALAALAGILAIVLAGSCKMPPPAHVDINRIDLAMGQGRIDIVCRGLVMLEEETKTHAAELLSKSEDADAVACLCDALEEPGGAVDGAVAAGMKDGTSDGSVKCLADLAENPSTPRQAEVVAYLARTKAPSTKERLGQIATRMGDPAARAEAVRAIGGEAQHEQMLADLAVSKEDGIVRAAAVTALTRYRKSDHGALYLRLATEDTEGAVRAAAFAAARNAGSGVGDELACKVMMDDPAPEVRKQAIAGLRGTKNPAAVACLRARALKEETDVAVREELLAVLKSSPRKEAAEALCDAIPYWMKTYVITDISENVPGTAIVEAQNARDFERSYECVQKAIGACGACSCYARLWLAAWMKELGGTAHAPNCPGYENPSVKKGK